LSRKPGNLACICTEATAYAPGKSEWHQQLRAQTTEISRDVFLIQGSGGFPVLPNPFIETPSISFSREKLIEGVSTLKSSSTTFLAFSHSHFLTAPLPQNQQKDYSK